MRTSPQQLLSEHQRTVCESLVSHCLILQCCWVPMASDCEGNEKQEPPLKEDLPQWKFLLFYLCFYGFMTQLRPGESFITPYLLSPERNFSREQRPKRSLFFNKSVSKHNNGMPASELEKINPGATVTGPSSGWRDSVFIRMLLELKSIVRHPQLRLWSLWWIFNSAGYYLMLYYVQILWNEIYPTTDQRKIYNGGVDAASTLLGAITSFAAGYLKIRWGLWSELVIGLVTAFQAGLLILMNTTANIWLCYLAYVLFRGSYQFLVPIAIFQIASSLSKELCALVFGVNTFFATVLKTIITIIIADKRGLALSVHPQFYVYFAYFTLLAVLYLGAAVYVIVRHKQEGVQNKPYNLPEIPAELSSPVQGTPTDKEAAIKTCI
ncbi:hypothetical protein FKM82_015996 [Ascaphus truei]